MWRNRISHELVRSSPVDDVPKMCCASNLETGGVSADGATAVSAATFIPSVEMTTLKPRAPPAAAVTAEHVSSAGGRTKRRAERAQRRGRRRQERTQDASEEPAQNFENPMRTTQQPTERSSGLLLQDPMFGTSTSARSARCAKRRAKAEQATSEEGPELHRGGNASFDSSAY